MMSNIGFMQALRTEYFECVIFQDVDTLPEDDRNIYSCPESPRHMAVLIDRFSYRCVISIIFQNLAWEFTILQIYSWLFMCITHDMWIFLYSRPIGEEHFGGVVALSTPDFCRINGYSNRFWAWGGEDNDLRLRLIYHNLSISRYEGNITRYTSLYHHRHEVNRERKKLLERPISFSKYDGLSSLKYKIVKVENHALYTRFVVEPWQRTV